LVLVENGDWMVVVEKAKKDQEWEGRRLLATRSGELDSVGFFRYMR